MSSAVWIKALSLPWDLRQGPYRAFFPPGGDELEASQKLLAELKGEPSLDPSIIHWAACQDTRNGNVVAGVLLSETQAFSDHHHEEFEHAFGIVNPAFIAGLGLFADVYVHPEFEQSPALQVLFVHCISELLKAGGHGALVLADIGHFSLFKRLGFRPIGPLQKAGYLPMICLPDYEYLSIIHSPLLPLLGSLNFAQHQPICDWYLELLRQNSELRLGSAFVPDDASDLEGHHVLTEGMSEEGKDILFHHSLINFCREGEVLFTNDAGGHAFGFIRRGIVKIIINGQTVVLLGEGDIIGEIAFILRSKRSAKAVAASSETEVVLFDKDSLEKLEYDADRTAIWRNLAHALAQRLVLTNQLLG